MDLIKETLIIGNKKAGVGRKDHGNEGLLQNPDTIPELIILMEADVILYKIYNFCIAYRK